MSILGIDIGTSTIKIIECKDNKILNKEIFIKKNNTVEQALRDFMIKNETEHIEKLVLTGIGAKKFNKENYSMPIQIIDEFTAIANGGLALANKREAIVVSIGTGTAFVKVDSNGIKHLGGTGVGAGTILNLSTKIANVQDFNTILELSSKGNIANVDLRIGDITDEEIKTLPKDLTLSNFGKDLKDAKKEDIVVGIINMAFEVIGMLAAFVTLNSNIKDVILIGNIVALPIVNDIVKKIEKTQNVNFIIPKNTEYAVVYGAIKAAGY